jgi:hypothetical protein
MDMLFFDFSSLHKKLQQLMREELSTLREVFDMMKEEELIEKTLQPLSKKAFFEKKTEINKRLKSLQKERLYLTKTLGQSYFSENKTTHFNSPFFNKIIEKDEENSLETFHLRDQILHFMKCIRQQKERLVHMKKQIESPCQQSQPQQIKKAAKHFQQTQTISLDTPSDGF